MPAFRVKVLILGLVLGGCVSSTTDSTEADLSEAIAAGDSSLVQEILDGGADPETPVVSGLTPLMRAANRNSGEIVRALLEAGAMVDGRNPDGLTPLHIAATADATAAMDALLDAGADVELRSRSGFNALDYAAMNGSTEAIETLITKTTTNVDAQSDAVTQGHGYPRDRGPTPLGLAARESQVNAINKLLDMGAVVDAPSASGHTPLLLAIFFDASAEAVEALLNAGADPKASARCTEACSVGEGEPLSAVEWAVELDREDLVALLQE